MPDSGWSPHSADDYAQALEAQLPSGIAWPRDPDSDLMRYIRGVTEIWGSTVDARAAVLLTQESDPRQTVEILPEWERAFGLPDECISDEQTIGERQTALVTKMTLLGRQDRQFFIDLAAAIGYTITISERSPFQFGFSAFGDNRANAAEKWPRWEIGPPDIRYHWIVNVGATTLVWWRFGKAQFGIDPHLRIARAEDLECVLRRYIPGHTVVSFNYT